LWFDYVAARRLAARRGLDRKKNMVDEKNVEPKVEPTVPAKPEGEKK